MAAYTFNAVILEKFNPYHDSKGRFSSANGAASFTYAPGKSKAHDMAIAREKERAKSAAGGGTAAIEVEVDNGVTLSYRQHANGYVTSMDGKEPVETNGLTIADIKSRAEKKGWKVKTYDEKQLQEYDAKRKKDREETDRFLNYHDTKNRSNTYRAPRKGWKGH